jgi:hypothetical protein
VALCKLGIHSIKILSLFSLTSFRGGWGGANENLNVNRNVSKVQTGCGCHVFV